MSNKLFYNECSILNAKYLTWVQSLNKDDAEPTRSCAKCNFCHEDYYERYFFADYSKTHRKVFYYCPSLGINTYFLCKDALKECVEFGEHIMLTNYVFNNFCDVDTKNIIIELYYIGLKNAKARCIKLKMEDKYIKLQKCIKRCNKIDKLTVKELRYFMTLNNMNYPTKGTGKNNGVVKIDYINKIKIECKNKKKELEKLQTILHDYQRKLIM